MKLTQTVAPVVSPVSLAEAKMHLGIEDDDTQDTLLSRMIAAATDSVQAVSGRQLVVASFELALDEFPLSIELPRPPLVAVDSVSYVDVNGAAQVLATSEYTVDTAGTCGLVYAAYDKSWPSTRSYPNAVTVAFTAGHAARVAVDFAESEFTVSGRDVAEDEALTFSNSGGALPAPLEAGATYYAIDVDGSTFQVSETEGGAAVTLTRGGSGTHFIGAVPPQLMTAINLLVAHWWENREAVTDLDLRAAPMAVRTLVNQCRVRWF
jgi:uncharacterized phiE125 gp8 family phage protein